MVYHVRLTARGRSAYEYKSAFDVAIERVEHRTVGYNTVRSVYDINDWLATAQHIAVSHGCSSPVYFAQNSHQALLHKGRLGKCNVGRTL